MLIGTNPRVEAPVLNARIRKAWLAGRRGWADRAKAVDLTYDYTISAPTAPRCCRGFDRAGAARRQAVVVIVGQGALRRRWRGGSGRGDAHYAEADRSGLLVLHTPRAAWARWMWAR
jgi:NADH-quinone oxidoreductase subunit G